MSHRYTVQPSCLVHDFWTKFAEMLTSDQISPAMIGAASPTAGIVAHQHCVFNFAMLYTDLHVLGKGRLHARQHNARDVINADMQERSRTAHTQRRDSPCIVAYMLVPLLSLPRVSGVNCVGSNGGFTAGNNSTSGVLHGENNKGLAPPRTIRFPGL